MFRFLKLILPYLKVKKNYNCIPLILKLYFLFIFFKHKKKAKHYFCKTCGVEPYYFPRSNTEMVAVTIYCVQLLPTTTVTFVVKD